jgi:biotin carboxyl carrier protein
MARVEVESEITGNVWKVEVSAGTPVAEGEVLIILESMKMEIPVESPVAGMVQEVLVQPEDQVEEDQLLLVIDA